MHLIMHNLYTSYKKKLKGFQALSSTILNVRFLNMLMILQLYLTGVKETLDLFERMSGLKVNEEKTNVVYTGSLANQMPNPNITQKRLKWVKDGKFKALGVNFSMQLVEMEELNYDMVLGTVSNLSIIGQIEI